MLIALLVVTVAVAVIGTGLMIIMLRRDEPVLGFAGLATLMTAGVMSVAYALLSSI